MRFAISLTVFAASLALALAAIGCAADPTANDGASASESLTLGAPPAPTFCLDGRIETVPTYLPSADGKECAMSRVHCLTKDLGACPVGMPAPPDCPGGELEVAVGYAPSADGKECSMPRLHCITKDVGACPVPALPLPFCQDGQIEVEPGYVPSMDGKECRQRFPHCVTTAPSACPML